MSKDKFGVLYYITRQCNLKCEHCYLGGDPKRYKETSSEKDTERVLNNLPSKTTTLSVSGGEILLPRPRKILKHILSYIKENKGAILPNLDNIHLHTNGMLVENGDDAFRFLEEMYDHGVKKITIGSYGKFHEEQGVATLKLDWDWGTGLRKLSEKTSLDNPIEIEKIRADDGIAFGERGKFLSEDKRREQSVCYPVLLYKERGGIGEITVDWDGMVYLCPAIQIPLGSVYDYHMDKILEMTENDSIIGDILLKKGFPALGEKFDPQATSYEKNKWETNSCPECEKLFEKVKAQISDGESLLSCFK